ncbi:MAG: sodium-dependent transporter, partial [Planctomycetes bacterium]|nr:sodium-dependent transporter [Planctomycetota bacterium]
VDKWMNCFGLAVVGLVECIIVGWLYKTGELRRWLNSVSEIRIGIWWEVCIKVVTPLVLIVTLVLNVIERLRVPYGKYPQSALLAGGWGVAIAVVVIGIALMLIKGTVTAGESDAGNPETGEVK